MTSRCNGPGAANRRMGDVGGTPDSASKRALRRLSKQERAHEELALWKTKITANC
ncbi:hypothetical protein PPGU16_84180 (plasmid) [Paraburkholderia largidicola]|uniref:Uncharacterized protein n=1 Tax=Paraburkholderia largidicola TaxID=3014751 RepID=A0A7I8C4F5_9BURK|nr:hypothetical protein PPGU16_84180 [Paraburkholderia sp. PGU16]